MSLWRIRITLCDDPRTLALFNEALAGEPVSLVRLAPRGRKIAEMTGEVFVELEHDERLGVLLGDLHEISPQVYVSRANPADVADALPAGARQAEPMAELAAQP
ncbi:MAG: hypothetical protein ACLQDY_04360 [Streptosporangiaceae bacterium]